MSIFVGFDGGGTYSRFMISRDNSTPDLTIIRESIKPSETSVTYSCSRFIELLKNLIGIDVNKIKGICISLSGIGNDSNKKEYARDIAASFGLESRKVVVESDSLIGLEAAYQNEPYAGIYVIVGTGSVITARTYNGQIIKAGGWGKMFGDRGSSYCIGLETMRYYCRTLDGLAQKGILFDMISSFLKQKDSEKTLTIDELIHSEKFTPSEIAYITVSVGMDDPYAELVTSTSVLEIVSDITMLYQTHSLQLPKVVTLHGGMLENQLYKQLISEELSNNGFTVAYTQTEDILRYATMKAKRIAS